MADEGKPVIFSPDGRLIGSHVNERVELRPAIGEWLVQMNDVASALKLGVHCSLCGADLIGKNGQRDQVFSVHCGCRDFVWSNRDWSPDSTLRH